MPHEPCAAMRAATQHLEQAIDLVSERFGMFIPAAPDPSEFETADEYDIAVFDRAADVLEEMIERKERSDG